MLAFEWRIGNSEGGQGGGAIEEKEKRKKGSAPRLKKKRAGKTIDCRNKKSIVLPSIWTERKTGG